MEFLPKSDNNSEILNDSLNKNEPLKYTQLYKGMNVIDSEGNKGVILNCDDSYNIIVQYLISGIGYYCFEDCCDDKLYIAKPILISSEKDLPLSLDTIRKSFNDNKYVY